MHDPDGITWEVEPASTDFGGVGVVPLFVAHNSADVERYLPFYTDTLGWTS